MSAEAETSDALTAEDVVSIAKRHYHIAVLAAFMGFMFWVRIRPVSRFTGTDELSLQAVDSFYHFRTTEWTVQNFPFTIPYDIFTGFPTGNFTGQFGTLFDQIIAFFALIIGLGSPGEGDILTAVLYGGPLLAVLVAIPVYKIGERLAGRLPALAGVAILALSPGEFLRRSTTGFFDHHLGEVLFMSLAVLALMIALRVGEQEKPVWELILDRDWAALKRPTLFSLLAGLAITAYLLVWPPGIVLIGIIGVFFIIAISIEYVRGSTPEYIAYVGIVSLGSAALFSLPVLDRYIFETTPTTFTLFHPFFILLTAAGILFMAWLARMWGRWDLSRRSYPVGIAGLLVIGVLGLMFVLPDVWNMIYANLTGRLLPFDPSTTALTVQEARPPSNPIDELFNQFGFAIYAMFLGMAVLLTRPFAGKEYRAEHLLVVVWGLFLLSMALTQVRFFYYLIMPVSVLSAVVVAWAFNLLQLDRLTKVTNIKSYQAMSLGIIVMVLFVPLLPPLASTTAMDVGDSAVPSSDASIWSGPNQFMQDNTPAPGNYGEYDNADQVQYTGTYPHPGESGYDYPDGSYGVMAWWDYGHLITTQAERIPHANPFQQNARSAATFFMSKSEERAETVLDAIEATGDGVTDVPTEELEQMIAEGDNEGEPIKYVMIDDQIAAFNPGKFQAITGWTDDSFDDFTSTQEFQVYDPQGLINPNASPTTGETINATGLDETYHNTMLASLYYDDGIGKDHYRLVHESEQTTLFGSVQVGDQGTLINVRLLYPSQALGGASPLQVALQNPQVTLFDVRQAPQLKTFERVEGATLEGQAQNANHSVMIQADIQTNTGREFTYNQITETDGDGNWNITVPYATNNELGPEDGYTNTSVTAVDDYRVIAAESPQLVQFGLAQPAEEGSVSVPEQAIYDGDTISVDLEEPASYELSDFEAPDQVEPNETFSLSTTVENVGGIAGNASVTVTVDGQGTDTSTQVSLEPGQAESVTLEHVIGVEGEYEIGLSAGTDTVTQTIIVGDPDPANFAVANLTAPTNATVDEQFVAEAEIENTGERTGDQQVALLANGTEVANYSVTLEPGESTTVTFNHTAPSTGSLTLEVATENDSASTTVAIEEQAAAEGIALMAPVRQTVAVG